MYKRPILILVAIIIVSLLLNIGVLFFNSTRTHPVEIIFPSISEKSISAAQAAQEETHIQATPSTTQNSIPSREPAKKKTVIKFPLLGSKIGDFSLTWRTPDSQYYAYDFDYGFAAEYLGTSTVRGKVFVDDMLGKACFNVSGKDRAKIPRIANDSRGAWFCFTNTDKLPEQLLQSSSIEQAIMIGGYSESYAPKETTDTTLLVKILGN